jgi:dTDP-4-amino-4,6-dideoxygalactose transaminase
MGGSTGQLPRIAELCRRRKLRLILDAAHMAGTRLNGQTPVGDAAVFSFHAVKPLPTADGGMICFENAALDVISRKKSWLGIDKDTYSRTVSPVSGYRWRYDVESVGFKYHGNSIMAAIGLVQLRHLDRDLAYRHELSGWYDDGFRAGGRIGVIPSPPHCVSARHLYQIEVANRDDAIVALNKQGIFPGVHYRDNRDYRMFRQPSDTCPNATRMSGRIISLPLHLRMSRVDVTEIVDAVAACVQ